MKRLKSYLKACVKETKSFTDIFINWLCYAIHYWELGILNCSKNMVCVKIILLISVLLLHLSDIESRLTGGFEIHLKFQGKFVQINVNWEYISQNPLRKWNNIHQHFLSPISCRDKFCTIFLLLCSCLMALQHYWFFDKEF